MRVKKIGLVYIIVILVLGIGLVVMGTGQSVTSAAESAGGARESTHEENVDQAVPTQRIIWAAGDEQRDLTQNPLLISAQDNEDLIVGVEQMDGAPVLLVNERSYPDIVCAVAVADLKGYRVLWAAEGDDERTKNCLLRLNPQTVYIVGGQANISWEMEQEIGSLLPASEVVRIAGDNRFDTAVKAAQAFADGPQHLLIVSGADCAEMMDAAVLAAQLRALVVYIDPTKIEPPPALDVYLHDLYLAGITPQLTVLGDKRAVSDTLLGNMRDILYAGYETEQLKSFQAQKQDPGVELVPPKTNRIETFVISAVGDCTLGTDPRYAYTGSLPQAYDQNGAAYFFSGVIDIVGQDDLTIANLETALTTADKKADKSYQSRTFWFSGHPSYTGILNEGSVEAVCVTNNHTLDFGEKGYADTVQALREANIAYCGNGSQALVEKKGVKVGLLAFNVIGINPSPSTQQIKDRVEAELKEMSAQADFIIVSFHWGIENHYGVTNQQKELAYWAADNGADLILGHHPHVLEPIEVYKGKYIVYSLGNFVFGGNFNPGDKDTVIFQQALEIVNGEYWNALEATIIPCKLSSTAYKNDYRPVPVTGSADYNRIAAKLRWPVQ